MQTSHIRDPASKFLGTVSQRVPRRRSPSRLRTPILADPLRCYFPDLGPFEKDLADERLARRARGGDVDDGIPEPHQGKDDTGSVFVRVRDMLWVSEGVDAVDGGW